MVATQLPHLGLVLDLVRLGIDFGRGWRLEREEVGDRAGRKTYDLSKHLVLVVVLLLFLFLLLFSDPGMPVRLYARLSVRVYVLLVFVCGWERG